MLKVNRGLAWVMSALLLTVSLLQPAAVSAAPGMWPDPCSMAGQWQTDAVGVVTLNGESGAGSIWGSYTHNGRPGEIMLMWEDPQMQFAGLWTVDSTSGSLTLQSWSNCTHFEVVQTFANGAPKLTWRGTRAH